MKKILLLLIVSLLLVPISLAQVNNSTNIIYFCDPVTFENSPYTYCFPITNSTIEKNAAMNNISIQYQGAMQDLNTISNFQGTANASQLTFAVKREAQIEILILKLLKAIYQIVI